MSDLFKDLKKKLQEKHPRGATFEEINKFCDKHDALRESKTRMDFIASIHRDGKQQSFFSNTIPLFL